MTLELIVSLMWKHRATKRYSFIGRKRPVDACREVWKMRAIEGHSILDLMKLVLDLPVLPDHAKSMPCIAHGTRLEAVHSIVFGHLSTMGRQSVMFSVFPRWDVRIGHGQRSGIDQWDAVIFWNKKSVLSGDAGKRLKIIARLFLGRVGHLERLR